MIKFIFLGLCLRKFNFFHVRIRYYCAKSDAVAKHHFRFAPTYLDAFIKGRDEDAKHGYAPGRSAVYLRHVKRTPFFRSIMIC